MSQIIKNSGGGGGGSDVLTLSDNVGTKTFPDASGNIQLSGEVLNGTGFFSTTVAGTNKITINPMSASRWIVDPLGVNGTHTTISAAIASASAGDLIVLLQGTYNESPVITKSLYFASYNQYTAFPNDVIVNGNWSINAAVNLYLYGLTLQNSAGSIISTTTTAAQAVISNCYLTIVAGQLGISQNASLSNIYILNCTGIINNGGQLFTVQQGDLWMYYCFFNTLGTEVSSSVGSGGTAIIRYSIISLSLVTSSTGRFELSYSQFGATGQNATWITTAGSQGNNIIYKCTFVSGTSSAISIGTGTEIIMSDCAISSSNTNAIAGAGSLTYDVLEFPGTSSGIQSTLSLTLNPIQTGLIYNANGSQSNPSYSFQNSTSSGMYWNGSNAVVISSGGQDQIRFFGGNWNSIVTAGLQAGVTFEYSNPGSFPYNVGNFEIFISVNTSGGAHTINVPNAPNTGQMYIIKDRTGNAASNNITITTPGGTVTFDGATSLTISTNHGVQRILFSGSNYEVW